jgi:hypothetical protein
MNDILKYILGIISVTSIWEFIKFIYPNLMKFFSQKREANNLLINNIAPILISASELYGKIESLAKEDFNTYVNPQNSNSKNVEHNKKYILYLYSNFFGQIQLLKLQNHFSMLSSIKKGKGFLRFLEVFESRKYRIIDRSLQRIIGEAMIIESINSYKILSMKDFFYLIENDRNFTNWIYELDVEISKVKDKKLRQRVLIFGVILTLFIDYFDQKNKIVRRRDVYKNKLSPRSKKLIKYHLLIHFLPFVKNKNLYY